MSLLATAETSWSTLDARWALAGVDPWGWSFRRLVDVLWTMVMDTADDDAGRLALAAKLNGTDINSQADADGWGTISLAEAERMMTGGPTGKAPGGS